MNAIIGFLAVSALAGLVLGLGLLERHYFGLAAIVVSGLILAISAAAILQNEHFDFLAGIAINLTYCSIEIGNGYLIAAATRAQIKTARL